MNSYGNGLAETHTYDQDYRLTGITIPAVESWTLGYNLDDDITGVTDNLNSSNNQIIGYDTLNRLNAGSGNYGSLSYQYDADSNRSQQTVNSITTSYTYATGNRLTKINTTTQNYDADGSLTGDGTYTYSYDSERLSGVTKSGLTASYLYNSLGQRAEKTVNGTTTVFVYDEAGHLLGEYTTSGALIAEHIWLNDRPIAVITPTGMYYVHTDQLDTPRYITNAGQQLVWEWLSDPFGATAPNQNPSGLGTFIYNLRMPGQVYDSETGHDYNYFRDYNPSVGRYVESDPIGLAGGINTYAYSGNNPVKNFDPSGRYCTSSGGWTFCAYPGGPAFELPTPSNFPSYLGPSNFILNHQYEISVPLDCTSPTDALQGLINNPTPGNPHPATINGTLNNAPVPPLFMNNIVTSYLTTDLVTGAPLVVNITGANSDFGPGYVAREVSDGSVNTYGEGLSPWQSTAFFSPNFEHYWDQRVWGSQTKSFLSKCGCSR